MITDENGNTTTKYYNQDGKEVAENGKVIEEPGGSNLWMPWEDVTGDGRPGRWRCPLGSGGLSDKRQRV